jgi:hypothetical protein
MDFDLTKRIVPAVVNSILTAVTFVTFFEIDADADRSFIEEDGISGHKVFTHLRIIELDELSMHIRLSGPLIAKQLRYCV